MKTEVAVLEEGGTLEPASVVDMIRIVLGSESPDVEIVERMVALQERAEDRFAARTLQNAIATFQSECPPIQKTKAVDFVSRSGTRVAYNYAPLSVILKAIRPALAQNGLSFTWDSRTEGGSVHCVCTVRHTDGGTTDATFQADIDTAAKMSGPQRTAAALTFAQRKSLTSALGIVAEDDTDAEGAPAEPITHDQTVLLVEWLQKRAERDGVDYEKKAIQFCRIFGVEAVHRIAGTDFEAALGRASEGLE